jgi:glycosyltransferase involved in cell wall biosynthesis
LESIDYVIPTWNSASTLQLTLQSIKRYGFPGKIVVVDRASHDQNRDVAAAMGCQVVGFSGPLGAARRIGAKQTSTEIIAYVDSDVELTPAWREILDAAWSKAFQDAGAIGAYYRGTTPSGGSFPIRLRGGNGAFGCMVTFRDLVLEFQELDKYSGGIMGE